METGRRIGRYRLLGKIGAGGMGEVYEAVDERLDRHVAVKVLPEAARGTDDARRRFEREARAVAALSHPNILAIHDYGVDGDVIFAVMELLEGQSLRDLIQASGSLPADRAVEIAAKTALGLAAAHGKGIVHRDLKPENLFLTADGQLKVLDFGLAKLDRERAASSGADLTTTTPGTMLGTVAYMAPEQARGEPVDGRCDLFALGVILYEMVAGENPFRREGAVPTLAAILNERQVPLGDRVTGLAPELTRIVDRCLAKRPEDRADDARRVARRLEALLDAGTGSTQRILAHEEAIDSLAVLPFANESDDDDVDFLSDGITETLIDNLSQIPRLRVMARSSVFEYRDRPTTPREAAGALGVRAILTGRLRRQRDTLVVRAELVDGTDGQQLWGGRFNQAATDLLEIEDEIAKEITDHLRFQLSAKEKDLISKRHTEDPEAYELYLRGRHVWHQWKTPEGMRTAIGFFERALERDPLFARARAGLADSYNMLGNIKALPPGEAYPLGKTHAQQGLAIDDSLAELHTSLGFVHRHWDWDWGAAEQAYRRAVKLNPGYALAHRWYGHLLAGLGRHEEAIVASKRAVELDPLSLMIRGALGDTYFYAGRYDEAIALYRETLEMDAAFLAGHTDLARSLELAGRYEEAIDEFRIAESLAPKGPPEPSSGLAHVYAQMGRRDEALAIVEELLTLSKQKYVSPYGIASIHACLGEVESALDWLEKAYDAHDQTLVWVKVHPRLAPLHDEPRYQAILERMKLA